MILAIDCGNTHVTIGCMDQNATPVQVFRLSSDPRETEFGYAATVKQILDMSGISPNEIDGIAISSVVPPLTDTLVRAARLLCPAEPLVVGAGVKSGLHLAVNDPGTVASDLVVTAVAAKNRYPLPAIIADLGTATTVTAVDQGGRFIGGAILPGVKLSLDALTKETALLPQIDLHAPKNAIAGDTVECMRSGIIYGNAGAVDALIDRFLAELKVDQATLIATGGLASAIAPYCKHSLIQDEHLALYGLALIWKKNR